MTWQHGQKSCAAKSISLTRARVGPRCLTCQAVAGGVPRPFTRCVDHQDAIVWSMLAAGPGRAGVIRASQRRARLRAPAGPHLPVAEPAGSGPNGRCGITAVIPERAISTQSANAADHAVGRPPAFDAGNCKARNVIERRNNIQAGAPTGHPLQQTRNRLLRRGCAADCHQFADMFARQALVLPVTVAVWQAPPAERVPELGPIDCGTGRR